MFPADQLTDGDHQRQQADQLRAQDIRQTADTLAGNSPDQARETRTGQKVGVLSNMQDKLKVEMLSVLLIAT